MVYEGGRALCILDENLPSEDGGEKSNRGLAETHFHMEKAYKLFLELSNWELGPYIRIRKKA